MSFRNFKILIVIFGCVHLLALPGLAQTGTVSGSPAAPARQKSDERSAQELYEEANGYLGRKFAEFNKQKLGYDAQLEAKTKQEQKELALANATILGRRKNPSVDDFYYLGMLQHLVGDSAAALKVMRGYLAKNPTGEKSQIARAVVVLHAARTNLLAEAETATEAYRRGEPLDYNELFGMETLLTDGFSKANDYRQMEVHARAMLDVARNEAANKKVGAFKRDERLFKSSSVLAEALLKLNRREEAIQTIKDLMKLSMALPSGNLYKMARIRLTTLEPNNDPLTWLADKPVSGVNVAPELVANQWIDQQPTKLAELRGHVVLLDFWAHWCGPCQYVFPKLQRWHETYKDKGLVILGVTNYFGRTNGRPATAPEELAYLKEFKKRNRLPYGFAVADSSTNEVNYGVSSIPMSFLIDRNGNVRFIAVGANDQETRALGKKIKELIEEPAPVAGSSGTATAAQKQ